MSTSDYELKVQAGLLAAIAHGFVEVIYGEDSEPRFRITELGRKHLDAVIEGKKEK